LAGVGIGGGGFGFDDGGGGGCGDTGHDVSPWEMDKIRYKISLPRSWNKSINYLTYFWGGIGRGVL
jgi:hypothetical protein